VPDNLEREVEEILRKLDNFVPEEGPLTRTRRRVGQAASDVFRAVLVRLSRVSLGQVMLVSAILVIGAFFFGRGSPLLARWVIIGGLILFFTAFILSVRGGGSRDERRWRGRVINLSEPGLADRLRAWLKRWNRRR
jgi:VIT1/CCC1 family predicted Fe2+/Mn2+ transporter